jgi:hypothetical protein
LSPSLLEKASLGFFDSLNANIVKGLKVLIFLKIIWKFGKENRD